MRLLSFQQNIEPYSEEEIDELINIINKNIENNEDIIKMSEEDELQSEYSEKKINFLRNRNQKYKNDLNKYNKLKEENSGEEKIVEKSESVESETELSQEVLDAKKIEKHLKVNKEINIVTKAKLKKIALDLNINDKNLDKVIDYLVNKNILSEAKQGVGREVLINQENPQKEVAIALREARENLVKAQENKDKQKIQEAKEEYDVAYQEFIKTTLERKGEDVDKRAKFLEKVIANEDKIVTKKIAELSEGKKNEQNKNVFRKFADWLNKGSIAEQNSNLKVFRDKLENAKSLESGNGRVVKMLANIGLGMTKNKALIGMGLVGGTLATGAILGLSLSTAGLAVPVSLGLVAARRALMGIGAGYATYDGLEGAVGAYEAKRIKGGTEDYTIGRVKKAKLKYQLRKAEKNNESDLVRNIKAELNKTEEMTELENQINEKYKTEDVKEYKMLDNEINEIQEKIKDLKQQFKENENDALKKTIEKEKENLKKTQEEFQEQNLKPDVILWKQNQKDLQEKQEDFRNFKLERTKEDVKELTNKELLKKMEYYESKARDKKINVKDLPGYDVYQIFQPYTEVVIFCNEAQ